MKKTWICLLLSIALLSGCAAKETPADIGSSSVDSSVDDELYAITEEMLSQDTESLVESSIPSKETSQKEEPSKEQKGETTSQEVASKESSSKTTSSKKTSAKKASSKETSSKEDEKSSSLVSEFVTSKTAVANAVAMKPVVLQPPLSKNAIVNYLKRPAYVSVEREIKALAKKYPDLIQTEVIGSSVQGRNLTVMKVGKGKYKALAVAGLHAREHITVSYLMRCVEEYCKAFRSQSGKYEGYDIKNLLSVYTLYVVPLVNPDGLEIIREKAQPNVTITYRPDPITGKVATLADYKTNANGVNLNKNFPLLWNKTDTKRPTPDAENYKGTSVASEPETRALMGLCKENDFLWLASFHVRGDCIYWSDALNPSVGRSEEMVDKLKSRCGFYKCPTSDNVNGFGGGFENWFRQEYQKPGFCIELMPLDIKVSGLNSANQKSFDHCVRWDSTKTVLPIMMIYGFVKK